MCVTGCGFEGESRRLISTTERAPMRHGNSITDNGINVSVLPENGVKR